MISIAVPLLLSLPIATTLGHNLTASINYSLNPGQPDINCFITVSQNCDVNRSFSCPLTIKIGDKVTGTIVSSSVSFSKITINGNIFTGTYKLGGRKTDYYGSYIYSE
jgi:hypothetical protein